MSRFKTIIYKQLYYPFMNSLEEVKIFFSKKTENYLNNLKENNVKTELFKNLPRLNFIHFEDAQFNFFF